MWRFNIIVAFLSLSLTSCVATPKQSVNQHLNAEGFMIRSSEHEKSERWGNYLFSHLQKRAPEKSKVIKGNATSQQLPVGYREIVFEIVEDLKDDYCIQQNKEGIQMRVRNEKIALWITYQLIDRIAEVNLGYDVHDLPPAIIDFNTHCRKFDFEYRDPHLMPNLEADYSAIIGTNMVEEDWGIWGHNLAKILEPAAGIYATVDGKLSKEQFCFSSATLHQQIKEFIIDEYGYGDQAPTRFMINPNDNDLVCTDARCVKLGNTHEYATPAVVTLVNTLAKEFPKHSFFTTAYRTVNQAPQQKLNENAGVLFSTIEIAKGGSFDHDKNFQQFKTGLKSWKDKTDEIYLWDYFSNFDDYLTPLPILSGLKKQLPVFKSLGVKGIFLNGSGYEYSSFEEVKTFASAALLMDATLSEKDLVTRYNKRFYPITHQLLSDYYLSLEGRINQNDKGYSLYGSISSQINSFLNAKEYIDFYEKLVRLYEQTSGDERKRVEKLMVALSFTRLQIAYSEANHQDLAPVLSRLNQFRKYDNLARYKEVGGELDEYSRQWTAVLNSNTSQNVLLNGELEFVSSPDEGYENSAMLRDGVLGFYTDYHLGWLLANGEDMEFNIQADFNQVKRIKISFLNSAEHRIVPPEKVIVMHDSKIVYEFIPMETVQEKRLFSIDEPVSFGQNMKNIHIKIIRSDANKNNTVALDEIQLLKK